MKDLVTIRKKLFIFLSVDPLVILKKIDYRSNLCMCVWLRDIICMV